MGELVTEGERQTVLVILDHLMQHPRGDLDPGQTPTVSRATAARHE